VIDASGRDAAGAVAATTGVSWGERLLSLGARIANVCASLLLGALAVVVLLQVVSRYLLRSPIDWTIDGATMLLIWVSFLGAATASFTRAHFAMEVIMDALPARVSRALSVIGNLLIVLILIELVAKGWEFAQLQMDQTYPSAGLPKGWAALAIPVSALLMVPRYLIDALAALNLLKAG